MIFKNAKVIYETDYVDIEVCEKELNIMKATGVDITNPDEILNAKIKADTPSWLSLRDFEFENIEEE